MRLSQRDINAILKRLSATDGGQRAVCRLAGITERVAYKMLHQGNVRQQTYDAFMDGLERLETYEAEKKAVNSQRAKTKPKLTLRHASL